MLAFTFPGQGSQRPGMGRPWVDHESWELVGEASAIADRDIGRLLLDADAEELKDTRNAQLTTFVASLMVVDAVERLGIEPAVLRRAQPRRVHGPHSERCARSRGGCPPRLRAGRGDARRRSRQPRHDGGGARPRRRPGRGGVPPGRPRRVGRQLQRSRPGRDRRVDRGRQRRQASRPRSSGPRRSCRCPSRVPSTRRSWPPPAIASARRSPRPTRATPTSRSCRTSMPSRTTRARSGPPALGPALQPCALAPGAHDAEPGGRRRLRRARSGRCPHGHGQAHHRRRSHPVGRHP